MNDNTQQLVRKGIGYAAGALAAYGLADQATSAQLGALALAVFDFGWWWYWNRQRSA